MTRPADTVAVCLDKYGDVCERLPAPHMLRTTITSKSIEWDLLISILDEDDGSGLIRANGYFPLEVPQDKLNAVAEFMMRINNRQPTSGFFSVDYDARQITLYNWVNHCASCSIDNLVDEMIFDLSQNVDFFVHGILNVINNKQTPAEASDASWNALVEHQSKPENWWSDRRDNDANEQDLL